MYKYTFITVSIFLCLFAFTNGMTEEHSGTKSEQSTTQKNQQKDAEWKEGPEFYGPGAEMIILEEEKDEADIYQMKVKLPDGYSIPPHWYQDQVRIDVISGILYVGSGDKMDKVQAKEIKAGGYKTLPPEMAHYAVTEGLTIIKLTATAPWSVNYVNPEDDPRNLNK